MVHVTSSLYHLLLPRIQHWYAIKWLLKFLKDCSHSCCNCSCLESDNILHNCTLFPCYSHYRSFPATVITTRPDVWPSGERARFVSGRSQFDVVWFDSWPGRIKSGQTLGAMAVARTLQSRCNLRRIPVALFPAFLSEHFEVRLRNGRSLQQTNLCKQISAWTIVEDTRRTIVVLFSYTSTIALCKSFPLMLSCLHRSDEHF